jgi:hypothetical protein
MEILKAILTDRTINYSILKINRADSGEILAVRQLQEEPMKGCMRANAIQRNDCRQRDRRFGAPLGRLALAAGIIGLVPGLAAAAPLPTCLQLGTSADYGLYGNPTIVSGTLTSAYKPPASATPAYFPPPTFPLFISTPTPTPATPGYCEVNFTYASGLAGPADGYDVNQMQKIQIRIVLPLSAVDLGVTGSVPSSPDGGSVPKTIQGNWLGKLFVSASPGLSDTLAMAPLSEGLNGGDQNYPIRLGYVGSMTDTGQHNPPFVVTSTNTLAKGTIADWAYRGTHYGKEWAATIAKTYYGKSPTRTYYNGVSGSGNEGMGQLMHYGDEYDGILVGAPAFAFDQFTLAFTWPYVVFKKMVQQGGTMPDTGQETALTAAVYAACDALDGLADGIINDPRRCDFKATANICGNPGAPASPNCLSPAQAAAFDRMWDGPRNKYGKRIWYPYDKSIPFVGGPFTRLASIQSSLPGPPFFLGGSIFLPLAVQAITWNHKNASFDPNLLFQDQESLALAGNPAGGITYADEATLGSNTVADFSDNQTPMLNKARDHGTKVLHFHGTSDPAIFWRNSVDYYRRVATWNGHGRADFKELQEWYRFFPIPDIGHGTGSAGYGPGPSPVDPFIALVKWTEKGQAPASITALAAPPAAVNPGQTRPLCPYPQTAIYNGSGATTVASSFHCGGNLETRRVVCDAVRTVYKHENGPALDYASVGLEPGQCEQHDGDHDPGHD